MLFFPAKCHDSASNKFYGEGDTWEPNDCTVCVCRNGTQECLATVCRHPECKEPIYIKGQCCPVCPLVDPTSTEHNEAGNKSFTYFWLSTIHTLKSIIMVFPCDLSVNGGQANKTPCNSYAPSTFVDVPCWQRPLFACILPASKLSDFGERSKPRENARAPLARPSRRACS